MIINTQEDVTTAVLAEIARAPDPRFREIMSAFVRHLHGFAREVKLTEEEFQTAVGYIVALGQKTTDSHNEAVLMSGSLGFSTLICLLNNGNHGATETTANLLGPFWRPNSPRTETAARWCARRRRACRSSSTPGSRTARQAGRGRRCRHLAFLDRGLLREPGSGAGRHEPARHVHHRRRRPHPFRSIKPAGYPIPVDGPTGDLLRAQGRANMRPAHLHFLIYKPGFKTHISQVYTDDDPHLETDSQFGVTRPLIGHYVRTRTSRHRRPT